MTRERLTDEQRADMVAGGGGNLYEPHWLQIDSGTFWRCAHGFTGYGRQCWRCGLRHPLAFARWWWAIEVQRHPWGRKAR